MRESSRPSVVRWVLGLGLLGMVALAGAARACEGETDPPAAPAAPAAHPVAPDGEEVRSLAWAKQRAEELGGGVRPEDVLGPHDPEADLFNPDGTARPALGGRIIVHLEAHPANLNRVIENSAVVTFMMNEMHDALLVFNWKTWDYDLSLAKAMWIEDQLVLADGRVLVGKVEDAVMTWRVSPASPHNTTEASEVPKAEARELMRSTVYTFDIREGVTWHDGAPFDARDALFTYQTYMNPAVDCDETRYSFENISKAELLGDHSIRFTFAKPYFKSTSLFSETLSLLPRHLYDLSDPANKDHKAGATQEDQGRYVNENPHNIQFVGLGPYKLREWAANQYIEAVRYDGYWQKDPARAGFVDTIRWRYIDGDDPAFQAVLNSEIDLFRRVKTEDYFGEATQKPAFTDNYYKAYVYTAQYGYTTWNMRRPQFADVSVRTALAHAFDVKGWVQTKYLGLAVPVTGPAFFLSPFYDHDVAVCAYDPQLAETMLSDAGWYDRNGDGTIDKDGQEFTVNFLMPTGNKASEAYGQKLQESLGKVGIKVSIEAIEWATFKERLLDRDFDAANLAWVMYEPESDPTQLWYGADESGEKRSSNYPGLNDPDVNRLIDAIRVEPDVNLRVPLWHELHQRIYALQPYLFGQTPPTKYAFNRKLHGVKLYTVSPGYRLREMYYAEGTPETRPLNRN